MLFVRIAFFVFILATSTTHTLRASSLKSPALPSARWSAQLFADPATYHLIERRKELETLIGGIIYQHHSPETARAIHKSLARNADFIRGSLNTLRHQNGGTLLDYITKEPDFVSLYKGKHNALPNKDMCCQWIEKTLNGESPTFHSYMLSLKLGHFIGRFLEARTLRKLDNVDSNLTQHALKLRAQYLHLHDNYNHTDSFRHRIYKEAPTHAFGVTDEATAMRLKSKYPQIIPDEYHHHQPGKGYWGTNPMKTYFNDLDPNHPMMQELRMKRSRIANESIRVAHVKKLPLLTSMSRSTAAGMAPAMAVLNPADQRRFGTYTMAHMLGGGHHSLFETAYALNQLGVIKYDGDYLQLVQQLDLTETGQELLTKVLNDYRDVVVPQLH